jgi:hypothetical protein
VFMFNVLRRANARGLALGLDPRGIHKTATNKTLNKLPSLFSVRRPPSPVGAK